jgi:formate-dependent nitrite reductase cytochrome c552 subunit
MATIAYCWMPLPALRTSGASKFKGKNVTNFLEAFNDMCENHGVREADKLKKVSRYCEIRTRE